MTGAPRSNPAVTFCQLTSTTPLNRAGSSGRTTYTRVRYAAEVAGSTVHCPSRPTVGEAPGAPPPRPFAVGAGGRSRPQVRPLGPSLQGGPPPEVPVLRHQRRRGGAKG